MAFSAATGLADAAWAVETAADDQAQVSTRKVAVAAVATPPRRLCNGPESSKDIKSSLPGLTGPACMAENCVQFR
jgi:hypothetical protein